MRTKLPLLLALLIVSIIAGDGRRARLDEAVRAEAQMVQPQFTAASLKGTCGFSLTSTNVVKGSRTFLHPNSAFGTLAFDGIGSVTNTITVNGSGIPAAAVTRTGPYTVGTDGRTGTLDFTAAGGFSYTFVIVTGGKTIRFISTGPVDPKSGIVDFVVIGTCKF